MARHKERLSEGLWTASDPGVLEPGQLVDARNTQYLAGSMALQRTPGRAVFGVVSATATAVVGLRDIQFDNGDQYLVALAGNKYRYAPIGDSGSFTDLATLLSSPTTLEAAQFRNRFYLFNGATAVATATAINSNLVAYLSSVTTATPPSTRQHGMLPVQQAPSAASAAGTFSQTVTGYYEYWTTEVARFTQDGADFSMESTFVGQPTTVFVSSTGYVPVIVQPTVANTGVTTHWRVYRSPKKDKQSDKKFPTGFSITPDISIAATSVSDTSTASDTGFVFPGNENGNGDGATVYADFANVSALVSDNNVDASATSTGLTQVKIQGVYGFNFGGFTGSVKGIEVVIEALTNTGTARVGVTVVRKRQSDGGIIPSTVPPAARDVAGELLRKINTASKAFTATTVRTAYTLGGSSDRWFASDNPQPLADSDFGTDFMVLFGFSSTSGTTTLSVDYVKVKVYYGATIDSVNQFATVVYTFGDVSAQVGKNGPPPSSNTGDFYEDSLVVNDVTNPGLIRYSYPGDPEAFPATYYLDFETRENDRVRAIKVVNDTLLVWLDSSTWRVNYLPSERDASFDRGKAIKVISSSYGSISPMCVTTFSPGGGPELAVFVSHHGIHATDGFSFETYTTDLNWEKILPASASPIALINDRKRKLLLFYFTNTTDFASETFLCMPMAYGAGHWDGSPKICGFQHMRNHAGGIFASLQSAWAAQRSDGQVSVYLGYGGSDTSVGAGKVYLETGTSSPALDPRLQFTTRRMFLADHGNEWELGEVYGYADGYDATTPTVAYTLTTTKTNDTGPTSRGTKTLTLSGQALHKPGAFRQMCEGATINMVATASGYAQEFILVDGTGFGLEDSGR